MLNELTATLLVWLIFWIASLLLISEHCSPRWALFLGSLPFLAANLLFFSTHSFMHYSIVYGVANGIIPPQNPLLSETPLSYAWLHHFLVAKLSNSVHLSPLTVFSVLNWLALLLYSVSIYSISSILWISNRARKLAVLIALIGPSPFLRGPLRFWIKTNTGFEADTRVYEVVKFMTVNSNGLGLAFSALGLSSFVKLIESPQSSSTLLLLLVSIVGVAHFYPLLLLGLGAIMMAFSITTLLTQRFNGVWLLIRILLVTAVAILISIPFISYLHSIRIETEPFAQINFSIEHLTRNLTNWGLASCLFLTISAVSKNFMAELVGEKLTVHRFLLLCTMICQLLFIAVHQTDHTEYKYLALSFMPLGILFSGKFDLLFSRSLLIGSTLFSLLLLPVSSYFGFQLTDGARSSDPGYFIGSVFHHSNKEEEALYDWIRSHTSPAASFIDTHLTIPPFTGRSLFVGLDSRFEEADLIKVRDGWGLPVRRLLSENFGSDLSLAHTRTEIASALLEGRSLSARQLELLPKELYLVSRGEEETRRIASNSTFKIVFKSGEATVLK